MNLLLTILGWVMLVQDPSAEHHAPISEQSPELRVLAFNILTSGHPPGPDADSPLYRESRQERIAEIILEVNPDIVLMQEAHSAQPIHARLKQHDPDWRMQGGGDRGQMILARHALEAHGPNSATVDTHLGHVFVHNVHWEPYPYGPYECQERILAGTPVHVDEILSVSDKGAVYATTYRDVHSALADGTPVVVGGDFNEPSHLDWSAEYLADGADRWVDNPTSTPLKAVVPWKGSRLLTDPQAFAAELDLGEGVALPPLFESFRVMHPDVVRHPGITWTPAYSAQTADRRPFRAPNDESGRAVRPTAVLDRIDIIYASANLLPVEVQVLGDEADPSSDLEFDPWPSDHRAVLARYRYQEGASQ